VEATVLKNKDIEKMEMLIFDQGMRWSMMVLSAFQMITRDIAGVNVGHLDDRERSKLGMMKVFGKSPIRVSMDQVTCMNFKNQTALVLSTDAHSKRHLWVTYDELKKPGTEKWEKFVVVMYSEREVERDGAGYEIEGIVKRYSVEQDCTENRKQIMDIALDILGLLYQPTPHVPLEE
jgi:hypothetical protein